MLRIIVLLGVAAAAACGSGATETSAPERTVPDLTAQARSDIGELDGLGIRLDFDRMSVPSGGTLTSELVVENNTSELIIDPGCRIGAGAYALVTADDAVPGAGDWRTPQVDCGGPFDMPPGFADRWHGPGFVASTKTGEPMPPGDYLAVVDIEGRTEHLSYPVTVTE